MRLLFCLESETSSIELMSLLKALAAKNHSCNVLLAYDFSARTFSDSARKDIEDHYQRGIVSEIFSIDLATNAETAAKHLGSKLDKSPHRTVAQTALDTFLLFLERLNHRFLNRIRNVFPEKSCRLFDDQWIDRTKTRVRRTRLMFFIYSFFLDTVDALFKSNTFDAVVLPEEVVGMTWESIVKVCRQNKIPIVVCPYTIANQEEAFGNLKHQDEFQTRNNWLAAVRYPRWRLRQDGFDLVRLPEAHIVAHERLKLTPPDPWLMNSGHIQALCVESAANQNYFVESGIPQERIHVTGSVALDEMYEIQQQRDTVAAELAAEMGNTNDRPLLVVSGCPNQLITTEAPYCEYFSMEDIAESVATALAPITTTYNCVIRPHPAFFHFGTMLARYGFHVSNIPTAQLIAISDLFVAFASSTIRWAVCCGIPTINYDVFHYNFHEYKNTAGVFEVKTSRELSQRASELSFGSPFYQEVRLSMNSPDGVTTVLDGKSVDRIDTVLKSLVPQSQPRIQ